MEVQNKEVLGTSLQISTEVIEKIAKMAALEVDGVAKVTYSTDGVRGILRKMPIRKAVHVKLVDDVAEITVFLALFYGAKAPSVCKKAQQNIKSAVQNMTHVAVSKVHIMVSSVLPRTEETEE